MYGVGLGNHPEKVVASMRLGICAALAAMRAHTPRSTEIRDTADLLRGLDSADLLRGLDSADLVAAASRTRDGAA